MAIETGGPAFPVPQQQSANGDTICWHDPGMTLRDFFAASAMQGMLSCQDFMNESLRLAKSKGRARRMIALFAYQQADAMLEQRPLEIEKPFLEDA